MADDTLTLSLDSGGDVVITLRPDLAPGHVERITTLAKQGFYDGVVFHRVIDGFMAQGGDPQSTETAKKDAWGSGGPGYSFADEIRSKLIATAGQLVWDAWVAEMDKKGLPGKEALAKVLDFAKKAAAPN